MNFQVVIRTKTKADTHQPSQNGIAYEVGTQIDAGSIGHGHPGVDGKLRESVGLGPAIRAPAGPVSFL